MLTLSPFATGDPLAQQEDPDRGLTHTISLNLDRSFEDRRIQGGGCPRGILDCFSVPGCVVRHHFYRVV